MSQGSFKDYFSVQAADYARYRPRYPDALFARLAEAAPGRALALDVATGSGQAAVALASHFDNVVATDASVAQLEHADAHPRVRYCCEPAEHTHLADGTVDLITVAQALHWFDLPRFWEEATRVLRPGGVIAVWCYPHFSTEGPLDTELEAIYREDTGPWWPPERAQVEAGYDGLDWPFEDIALPDWALTADWTLEELWGYLHTWSATQRAIEATGKDPIRPRWEAVEAAWGQATRRRFVWPLKLRAGRRTATS
ncbi:class I SAM-dependent methyltransferase [Gulbenkiania mobilis]|uniref:Methyltransferase family protein n=1 Tax=Gulbenkiania mobilis TaxID=397457 RepID=A0ABY2CX83_GULMO|nr:methyltransferase family protein [Gulbenkiania mobilis]